ncbi:MAG: ABC transporter permease [Oscillospiraceae bacterium]|nr:ABC transporter permease [Oscillospiraceae bacterium]
MDKVKKKRFSIYYVISALSVIGFVLLWQYVTAWSGHFSPAQLPSPVRVFQSMIAKLTGSTVPTGATLGQHILASLRVSLTGFTFGAVIGVPLGIGMAWNKKADQFFSPMFDLIRPIPPIAWIPVMIVLFGIGVTANAAIIFMAALVPCIVNSYTGIKQVNEVHIWVGRIFGASRRELLVKIAVPTALPNIFTGLRVALMTSWVSLVAAEMLAATRGLGFMIQSSRQLVRPDVVIVGMVTIGVIGAFLAFVLTKIENKLIKGLKK